MKKSTIFLGIFIFILGSSFNQLLYKESEDNVKPRTSNEDSWESTWHTELVDEWAWDSVLDSSNNIYITGITNISAANGRDILLLKFDSSGDFQWNEISLPLAAEILVIPVI